MAYVQYGHTTDAEREHEKHERELDRIVKEYADWNACLGVSIGILRRTGMTDALRKQIAEAGKEAGDRLRYILEASPPRIEAPKERNRY